MINSKTVSLSVASLLTAAAGTWLVEALYYYFTQYSYSLLADGQADFRIPYEFLYLALLSWAVLFHWLGSRSRLLLASLVALLGSLLPITIIVATAFAHSSLSFPQIWERVRGAYEPLITAQFIVLALINILFWWMSRPALRHLLKGAAH